MDKKFYDEQLKELTELIKFAKANDNEALAKIILGAIDLITELIKEEIHNSAIIARL